MEKSKSKSPSGQIESDCINGTRYSRESVQSIALASFREYQKFSGVDGKDYLEMEDSARGFEESQQPPRKTGRIFPLLSQSSIYSVLMSVCIVNLSF